MGSTLQDAAGAALDRATLGPSRLPGVVAVATGRDGVLYAGAAGVRSVAGGEPMTTDTVLAILSCTKAITGTAVLQCVEEGLVDLDAPASRYAPEIAELQVLDGFAADGAPLLRPPKRDVTTRMLLLHTAGFGYDHFNAVLAEYVARTGLPNPVSATRAALRAPLLFDPGDGWEYGIGVDWCGQVVEAVRGQRLGDVVGERILDPLGMRDTGFTLTAETGERLATVHRRDRDGGLKPLAYALPHDPEVHMGGHGLYATAGDYARFIRMWLADGAGDRGPVLRPDTVAWASADGLGGRKIHPLPGVDPRVTHDIDLLPGIPQSWAYTFMVNDEPAPTGRAAGSLAWAGLANVYYWIDRRHGVGGIWGTQLFPFGDPAARGGFEQFETAVYAGR